MLEPQSRRLLMESFQPPQGHRLDWAVGTTYSLDLIALLSAPVAFAFSDWQDRDGRPTLEPLALLKAVRQYADRICLFCQAGKIHVPRAYQPLLANLEGSIVEAKAPRGGSFHPKVWFLRYQAADGSDSYRYRLLCLSRNMTFDRSWDTMLCLEGLLRDQPNEFRRNRRLGQFAESLLTMTRRGVSDAWRRRLKQLAYELRRVEFDPPQPFDEMNFWPLGLAGQELWPFPKRIDELLVVAPFIDDGFVADFVGYEAPMRLVSRPENLARLQPAMLDHFKKVWILDETAEPESADTEEAPAVEGNDERPLKETSGESFDEIPLVGLHAKLYVANDGWNAHVWTGSPNATRAAFTRNVEFLVELHGKRSQCGVTAVLGQPGKGAKKYAACLADLLQPYVPRGDEATNSEEADFERLVDNFAKQLADSTPVATCESLSNTESFALAIRHTRRVVPAVPAGCRLRARPISLPEAHMKDVDLTQQPWVRFEPVSLFGLTAFMAFELISADERFVRRFVLNTPLENAPVYRHERILRHLLSDPDRVLRFLLLLLMDHGARDFGRWLGDPASTDGKSSIIHGMFDATLFESLMRALDRDPERIDQVAQIIDDLRRTADGRGLLPPNLEEIWEPIWQVRQSQLAHEQAESRK